MSSHDIQESSVENDDRELKRALTVLPFSRAAKMVVASAIQYREEYWAPAVDPVHIFLACMQYSGSEMRSLVEAPLFLETPVVQKIVEKIRISVAASSVVMDDRKWVFRTAHDIARINKGLLDVKVLAAACVASPSINMMYLLSRTRVQTEPLLRRLDAPEAFITVTLRKLSHI